MSLATLALLGLPALVILALGLLTPANALFPNQFDVYLYFQNAEAFASGQLPYRGFPFEYPPLALVPMAVPYLLWPLGPPPFEIYHWLFLAWEAALLTALVVTLGAVALRLWPANGDRAMAIRLFLLTIVAAPSLAWRFDLFPALLGALAILAGLSGRAGLAGAAIALGVLAKLFPAVLAPVIVLPWLLAGDWRRASRFVLVGSGVFVFVLGVVYGLVGDAIWSPITYQNERGLQAESLGAGLLLLRAVLTETPARLTFDHSAVHVAGPWAERILAIQLPVLIAALGGITALTFRRFRTEIRELGAVATASVITAAAATVAVLLLTNKVFSVQYVVWLLPFAALLRGRQLLLFALIAGLSIGIHPLFYDALIRQEAAAVYLLNARNVALVALAAWLVRELANVARPAGLEPTTFRSAT